MWPTNLNSSWRKRVTKHEIEWQYFKIDRPKTKLKRAFAHSRGSGTKLKTHFLNLNEEMMKMGGKTYIKYLSFKFVKCYKDLYFWETDLSETLTKMNANRLNLFCCLVLSYCDWRIWIAIDEKGDKARNWMTMFQNWSTKDETETAFAHSRVYGTKLKHIFKLNEELTKMGGKTYI